MADASLNGLVQILFCDLKFAATI
ncbi:hypothetical protein EYZ11_005412 [Aspergillus tanneri]|uniref:Uncharacterized protein n=1 Tax=Aspergillus tanneri TaxID=1220188 RepID=A0A4S3JKH8_9EURO|nr:hypothetical protein EYZ11_005412 [Aspergillus tanneri]